MYVCLFNSYLFSFYCYLFYTDPKAKGKKKFFQPPADEAISLLIMMILFFSIMHSLTIPIQQIFSFFHSSLVPIYLLYRLQLIIAIFLLSLHTESICDYFACFI